MDQITVFSTEVFTGDTIILEADQIISEWPVSHRALQERNKASISAKRLKKIFFLFFFLFFLCCLRAWCYKMPTMDYFSSQN